MASYFARKFLKQVRNSILTGVLILIPLVGSVFIVVQLFKWADRALPSILGMHWASGIGFLVSLIIAYFVGLAAKNWFGKKLIATGNSIIISIPFLNKIYLVLKQIIDTVTLDRKKLFDRAVLVEFPRKGSFVIGIVTSENNARLSVKAGQKLLAVFVPKVPNPTTGFLLYLPEEEIIDLDISVEAAIKLVVSAGLLGAEMLERTEELPSSVKHWNWMDIFWWRIANKKTPPPVDPRD
jgi:uncharacterized membrane protein